MFQTTNLMNMAHPNMETEFPLNQASLGDQKWLIDFHPGLTVAIHPTITVQCDVWDGNKVGKFQPQPFFWYVRHGFQAWLEWPGPTKQWFHNRPWATNTSIQGNAQRKWSVCAWHIWDDIIVLCTVSTLFIWLQIRSGSHTWSSSILTPETPSETPAHFGKALSTILNSLNISWISSKQFEPFLVP